jgi:dihydrodipicolinate synthase/N-acetylneuraminate lyase
MLNMASEELRLPLTPLDETKKDILRQTLKTYGLLS